MCVYGIVKTSKLKNETISYKSREIFKKSLSRLFGFCHDTIKGTTIAPNHKTPNIELIIKINSRM